MCLAEPHEKDKVVTIGLLGTLSGPLFSRFSFVKILIRLHIACASVG